MKKICNTWLISSLSFQPVKKVVFLLMLTFWVASCKKTESDPVTPANQPPAPELGIATNIRENAKINDQYDVMGRLWYDHQRTNAGGDPDVYLAPDYRNIIIPAMNEVNEADKYKSLDERVAPLLDKQILTVKSVENIKQFDALIENMPDNVTHEDAWIKIRQFEVSLIENSKGNEDDIIPALYISSIIRNQLTYDFETRVFAGDREDCFLGRKLSCWEKTAKDLAFKAFEEAIKAAVGYIASGGGELNWNAIKNAALKTGGIAAVIALIKIYTDKDCKCNETEPTPISPCAAPSSIGLMLGGCDEIQTARVSGFGSSGVGFTWSVVGGIAVDFPGATTGILTAVPTLRIKQNDPNIPMTITCFVSYLTPCSASIPATATINVFTAINNPGTVIPSGATNIAFGDPTIFRYLFNGSYLASPNSVLLLNNSTFTGCSYHGTIMGSGFTAAGSGFIDVKWNVKTNSWSPANVFGTSENVCSGLRSPTAWLSPINIQ
jgi:hypothetical protein